MGLVPDLAMISGLLLMRWAPITPKCLQAQASSMIGVLISMVLLLDPWALLLLATAYVKARVLTTTVQSQGWVVPGQGEDPVVLALGTEDYLVLIVLEITARRPMVWIPV